MFLGSSCAQITCLSAGKLCISERSSFSANG